MSILSDIRRGEALYSSGRNNNPYDLVRANVALSEARTTERNKESGKILSEMNTAIPGVFVEGGLHHLQRIKMLMELLLG